MAKRNYVYDIETYPNFFCAVFKSGSVIHKFEISERKNDLGLFKQFYNDKYIKYGIGFNNVRFDAQILEFLIKDYDELMESTNKSINQYIFSKAQLVIEKSNNREMMPFFESKMLVKQIDVFLMLGYNGKARQTSLKWAEYSMNYHKVQDLPYKFNINLDVNTLDEVIDYCINDVSATEMFVKQNSNLVKLRIAQQEQYPKLSLLNKSDSSVGELLFLYEMSKEMDIDMKELRKMRTPRQSMPIKDLILPYIKFDNPQFKEVLDNFNKAMSGGFEQRIRVRGLEYVFGEGGIHASWDNRIFESNDEYVIIDLDVASYYPNLAIVNGFKPEHLGDAFSTVYKNIYEERKKYPKGTVENQSLKIILNGSYGKLGDEYSFLYDIKPQLQICINGQLLLLMLAEKLMTIPDLEILQMNTDGVSVKLKRTDVEQLNHWWKWWEDLTQLQLEDAVYSKMIINNVNNYIAVYEAGYTKQKGMYEVDQETHKNRSQRIVKLALNEYFVNGKPIRETIENHMKGSEYKDFENQGVYDFCLGKKVKWNQQYVIRKGVEEKKITEKVVRYYITKEKSSMMKKYSDGRIEAVNKGYNAKLFQEFYEDDDYGINYEYYINECYKVTSLFEGGNEKVGFQQKLELF